MDALPQFDLVRPKTFDALIAARAAHPGSSLLGGGTDLIVNIRRGIVAPPVLIDINGVAELRTIKADAHGLAIGAAATLAELAAQPDVARHYPALAQAAGHVAGPTQRAMGTVGGNLCLDTRCIFYNQSEWWRDANRHCLKTTGTICHVAPKSRGVCFATFSGDLAPALLVLDAEIDIAGPAGKRTMPLADLYIGYARQDEPVTQTRGDGKYFLSLRAGEFIAAVRAKNTPGCARPTIRSAFAARSNIRSPGSPWRCGATATRSPICASPSPAPIRGRCDWRAPRNYAAAASTRASLPGSTRWCAIRSWQ